MVVFFFLFLFSFLNVKRCSSCLSLLLSCLTHTQALSEELKLAPAVGGSGEDGWSCDCPSCWHVHLPVCLSQGDRAVQAAAVICQDSKNNLCKIWLLKQRQNLLNHSFIYPCYLEYISVDC